jgi:biopolymer transport protein ExbB
MKILGASLSLICLAGAGHAQQPEGDDSVGQLSRSAARDLAESIQELTELREQIATEKLPLSEQLTALEDRLAQLRRDHDRITRLVDEGNLEIANIKAEAKAREDELAYVGNLLDEYARTFESKVNVSELQYCGDAVETAKRAAENTTLSMTERFARQLAFADLSLKRLFDALGGMRFPGVGVDLTGALARGQFAIVGPVALFRSDAGDAAGLVVPQSGSSNPLIRPLEGALQTGLAALVESGEGLMPLDPSRGGALKALVQKTNLIHIFEKGGPIMWPLLLASILALGTVVERLFFLSREKLKRDPKALERFFAAIGLGDIEGAIQIGKESKFYVVRALGYALSHRETSLPNALVYAQAQELKRFQRGIPILDTVITLAPLLGLLGTVTGMMGSFSLIGGELSAPGAITGGIAEALIATAFGLGIAITALLPFNFLNARMENARHEIESAATQLELLVQPRADAAAAPRTNSHPSPVPETRTRSNDEALHREVQRRRDLRRRIAELQEELEDYELSPGGREPVKE